MNLSVDAPAGPPSVQTRPRTFIPKLEKSDDRSTLLFSKRSRPLCSFFKFLVEFESRLKNYFYNKKAD